jgi:ubiquinone/menaquinone biosynthesis C-methylase UbiE
MLAEELQGGFERLKPWINKFIVDGKEYGGTRFDPRIDFRLPLFFEAFPNVRTVLDLGCLEGAESLRIASHPSVKHVVGLDVNPHNLEKANFVKQIYKADKIKFALANLELASLTEYGWFDVAFCCGVLYHLPEPWKLVEQLALVTDNVFLWTQYSGQQQANVLRNGYRGWLYAELPGAPEAGASPESFWLTRGDLQDMFRQYGFTSIRFVHEAPEPHRKPSVTLVARK